MAPALAGLFLPLLLLFLGLWESSVCTKPENITAANWFEIQHIHPRPLQCNEAMRKINSYIHHCKSLNTFLHDSFTNVAIICKFPSIICKNGEKNCHQSPNAIPITLCNLTSGKYPKCNYRETSFVDNYIVACNPHKAGDPPGFRLVPVHLDNIVKNLKKKHSKPRH